MSSRPRLSGRPTTAEHQAAIARRLDQLRAELAAEPRDTSAVVDSSVVDVPADGGDEPWWGDATRVRPALGDPHLSQVSTSAQSTGSSAADSAYLAPEDRQPGLLPMPGRHASRRGPTPRAGLLPPAPPVLAAWQDRFALGPAQVAVVAVVVSLGLAVTAWLVVRASPEPVPVSASTSDSPAAGGEPAASSAPGDLVNLHAAAAGPDQASTTGADPAVAITADASSATGGVITVDVAGKVRRPGIAVLQPGARVVDAIEAAGGARSGVDLTSLNLARPLVDGEQVLVGVEASVGAGPGLAGGSTVPSPVSGSTGVAAAGAVGALIDLNAATEDQLDTLPEVGPVTAASIVAWRSEHGGFSAVEELLEVDGIGEATLARIAPHVTV